MTNINKIGVIGAMNEEVVSLTKMLNNKKETRVAGLTFMKVKYLARTWL